MTARPAALITAEKSDDTGIEPAGDGWAWVLGLAFGEAFEATGVPSGAGRVAIGTISAASASMVAASATAREVGFGETGSKNVLTGGAGSTAAGATAATGAGSGAGGTIMAGASTKLSVGAGSIETDTDTSADATSGDGSEGTANSGPGAGSDTATVSTGGAGISDLASAEPTADRPPSVSTQA
ncbi:MAG: hypothetical protein WCJ64_10705 [Rhodospirillaceae bacterium]